MEATVGLGRMGDGGTFETETIRAIWPRQPEREGATRMAVEPQQDAATTQGAIAQGRSNSAWILRPCNRVRQTVIDGGARPGTTRDEQRLTGLEREVRELRRANHI